jgi:hypothetical protein
VGADSNAILSQFVDLSDDAFDPEFGRAVGERA